MKINYILEGASDARDGNIKAYITDYAKVSINDKIKNLRCCIQIPRLKVAKEDWIKKGDLWNCKNTYAKTILLKSELIIQRVYESILFETDDIEAAKYEIFVNKTKFRDTLYNDKQWIQLFGLNPIRSLHTISEFIRTRVLTDTDLKPNTKSNYRSLIICLDNFHKQLTFEQFSIYVFTQFKEYLKKRGNKPVTIYHQIGVLKGLFKRAIAYGITINPDWTAFSSERPIVNNSCKYLTETDCRLIESFIQKDTERRCWDSFLFLRETGLRESDRYKCTLNSIHIVDGSEFWFIEAEKTGKECVIPVTGTAKKVLEKYNGCLPPLSNKTLQFNLRMLSRRAGIKFTAHWGRHSFVNGKLASNMSEDKIRMITGHTTSAGLAPYMHLKAEDKARLLINAII